MNRAVDLIVDGKNSKVVQSFVGAIEVNKQYRTISPAGSLIKMIIKEGDFLEDEIIAGDYSWEVEGEQEGLDYQK